jgi:hypothetical protein
MVDKRSMPDAMDEQIVQAVSKEIYRRFPAVRGKKPKVRLQQPAKKAGAPKKAPAYVLTFCAQVTTSTLKRLPYRVRVVVDESGKILKITTSR